MGAVALTSDAEGMRSYADDAISPAGAPNRETNPAFTTRGVYFHDGFEVEPRRLAPLHWGEQQWRQQVEWLRICGINAIEFATMLEFNRIPITDREKQKVAHRQKILNLTHELGLQFGYILTNTVVSTVPADEEPGNQLENRAVQLCPRVAGNFEKTVELQTWYMDAYKEADFFEEFAADWGACHCGTCDVQQYLRYVEELADRVAQRNSNALLYANTWCISYWGPFPVTRGWKYMFEQETVGSREVIAALPGLRSNVNLALPCHNLYRQLVFNSFEGKLQTPTFPTQEDLRPLLKAGRKVLAWPHFLMDDDTGRAPQWGLVHSEVRYLRSLLMQLQGAGIDRVMGNLYLPTLQLINAFAFGQLTINPQTDPATILREFARLIAHREDADRLFEILCWLDNRSYWNHQLTPDARIEEFPSSLDRAGAIAALKAIRPCASPAMPLPTTPSQWLDDLARSIPKMTWAN